MIIKNKIVRDTIILTVMQLFLDSAALLLNIFITRQLGTSAMGILSLTGSFLILIGMVSNGNAFLCISRLVSEEIGKKNGNPNRILKYGLLMCTFLSVLSGLFLIAFSEPLSIKFFKSAEMSQPIKLMAAALPIGAYSACFKGFFNASRTVSTTAMADILEFAVKAIVIIVLTFAVKVPTNAAVCDIMVSGIIAGNCTSLVMFLFIFFKNRQVYSSRSSLSLKKYISLALPVMAGGCLTSILSSANDALIPVTLRQYGNSVKEAFSQFGVFEAIVIPTLFFPSVVICSLSGIVVSETARAAASKNMKRIKSIAGNLIEKTLIFSILVAAVLMHYGSEIGTLLDGGELAGRMITIIAPVVPFIYLEIILEAMIKGMGLQGFSSLNYLAEYAVRISVVLIFVPRIGFYGIVASYYASNIIGNVSRFIKIMIHVKPDISVFKVFIMPTAYVVMTMKASELLLKLMHIHNESLVSIVVDVLLWSAMYIFMVLGWKNQGLSEKLFSDRKVNHEIC